MEPTRVRRPDDLEQVLLEPVLLLFKHSPRCSISAWAWEQFLAWRDEHPAVPTAWIDVVEDPRTARVVAQKTGIAHASPQAVLLRDGAVAWSASHGAISRKSLTQALESGAALRAPPG